MKLLICSLTIIIFINSIRYSIYEIQQKNRIGGIVVVFLGLFQLIFTNLILFLAIY